MNKATLTERRLGINTNPDALDMLIDLEVPTMKGEEVLTIEDISDMLGYDLSKCKTTIPNKGKHNMKTATIQVSNSLSTFPHFSWVSYTYELNSIIEHRATQITFFGGSENWASFQAVVWVIKIKKEALSHLLKELKIVKESYSQDSIFITCGKGKGI